MVYLTRCKSISEMGETMNNGKILDLLKQDATYSLDEGVYMFNFPIIDSPDHRFNEIADLITQWYNLPRDEETKYKVMGLFTHELKQSNASLMAENEILIDRFNLINMDYKIEFVKQYVTPVMPVKQNIYRNIRVRNNGFSTWTSSTETPMVLSYHWHDSKGNVAVFEGVRTAFPAPLKAGREMTIPLQIQTPDEPGDYVLEVVLLHELVKWADDNTLKVNVSVLEKMEEHLDLFSQVEASFSEKWDDDTSLHMLMEHILQTGQEKIRLLEIGGSAKPKVIDLIKLLPEIDIYAVNTDASASLLKLGMLHYQHNDREILNNVDYVCCDANNSPFKEKSFDGVIMFRTLHHFEDLEQILLSCKNLLKDYGFIALMCEPVGNAFDEATIKLIEKGVNEQVFSIEEYLHIFERVDLNQQVIQIDFMNSLKTILVK